MILNEQSCIRLLQGIEISLRSVARFWGRSPRGHSLEKITFEIRRIVIDAMRDQKRQKQEKQLKEYEAKKKEIEKKYNELGKKRNAAANI